MMGMKLGGKNTCNRNVLYHAPTLLRLEQPLNCNDPLTDKLSRRMELLFPSEMDRYEYICIGKHLKSNQY